MSFGGGGAAWSGEEVMYPEVYSVEYRDWDIKTWPKLDLDKPSTFTSWFNRAQRWLTGNGAYPAVKNLLEKLQFEQHALTTEREIQMAAEAGFPVHWDPKQVSRAVSNAIVKVSAQSIADLSATIGEERGFELYRHVFAKMRGAGPGMAQAALDKVMNPSRCANTAALRDALVEQQRTLRELERYGPDYALSPPQREMALKRLLPNDLLRDMENAMLPSHESRLLFVQNRIDLDHQRGLEHKKGIGSLRPGAQATVPDFFGNEDDDEEEELDHDDQLIANLMSIPDPTGDIAVQIAYVKGRKVGKAKGGGRGGKGEKQVGPGGGRKKGDKDPKGAGRGKDRKGTGGGGGGKATTWAQLPADLKERKFTEGCWFCGDAGHRRHECGKLTAAAKARGLRFISGSGGGGGGGTGDEVDDWYLNLCERDAAAAGEGSVIAAFRRPTPRRGAFVMKDAFEAAARLRANPCEGVCCANRFSLLEAESEDDEGESVGREVEEEREEREEEEERNTNTKERRKSEVFSHECNKKGNSDKKDEEKERFKEEMKDRRGEKGEAEGRQEEVRSGKVGSKAAGEVDEVERKTVDPARASPARLLQSSCPEGFVPYVKYNDGPQQPHLQRQRATRTERSQSQALSPLYRPGPRLSPVARQGRQPIRAVIDSGAEDTVAPPGVMGTEVRPSAMSAAGLTYRAANGAPIQNFGETTVRFRDASNTKCGMHFQVADVERPLVSVARMADAGNKVVMEKNGGYVEHVATGKRIALLREGNVFVLDMHLDDPAPEEDRGGTPAKPPPPAGFTRRER